jgi:hypothetical protein
MITYEKVSSYWGSTVNIYELIQEFAIQGKYKNIVVPSRGVCPIYMATQIYHQQKVMYECSIFPEVRERLEWKAADLKESQSGQIWLPFTAQTGNKEEDENTYKIRLNWCKVLKSIICNENSINSIAYHVLTDAIGKEYGHTRARIIRNAPILLIDTVVSGRAATEIAQALEEVGLDYKMILAVDAKGNKLHKDYKSQLLNKYADRVKLVDFEDLFTEDQGPIYTNIFGVIYPNLTKSLRDEFSDPSIAVGSLHMENGEDILCKADRAKLNRYKQKFPKSSYKFIDKTQFKCDTCRELGYAYNGARGRFSQLLFNFGLEKLWRHNISDLNFYLINELNEILSKYRYSNTSTTLDLFERTTPLNMDASNEISSSHVVRCNLEMNDVEALVDKIKKNTIRYEDMYI